MRKIALYNKGIISGHALVDDEDFEYLNQWRWHISSTGYAHRREGSLPKLVLMHRVVNNTPDGLFTDHINRDRLDNRRMNLRWATRRLNQINSKHFKNNSSGFKGVSWDSQKGRWLAYISIKGKLKKLGRFIKKLDAIQARKNAEFIYYSDVTRT